MPPDQPQADLFAALNERFANRGLLETFPAGLIVGEEIPGTDFPYAVLDPGSLAVATSTATGEYAATAIQITVYDKTFDLVKAEAAAVREALRWAPLPLTSGPAAKHCKPQGVRYAKEDAFYKAVLGFEILTGEAVLKNPPPGGAA